jgi:hypothetical protein
VPAEPPVTAVSRLKTRLKFTRSIDKLWDGFDTASLQKTAASLESDSQTAQANLPPSCAPDVRADYGAALNDASKATLDCRDAVSEMGSGNYNVAADDVNAADVAITASGNKFQAATPDARHSATVMTGHAYGIAPAAGLRPGWDTAPAGMNGAANVLGAAARKRRQRPPAMLTGPHSRRT